MDITLHITSPETEARLREQAMLTGRPLESLVLEAIEERFAADAPVDTRSPEARLATFRAWIEAMPEGNPDADLSRESAYGLRGQ
jgi:hypothetical protein